ncbi:MAG: uracil-DNA glycosylase, partial [Chloroflexota bacterium]
MVERCTDCPLSRSRTNAVPGEGPADAEIMFIGEGPGYHEDRQGRPFVGPAGQFLEGLLASIGTGRERVFIANMVKCRPPENRDPLPAEIAACSKYLDRQIELVNPRLIVTLGR